MKQKINNMAKLSDEIKIKICLFVFDQIENNLFSFRKSVLLAKENFKEYSFSQTGVFGWFSDLDLLEHYARVCANRQEALFEEVIELSDGNNNHLDDPIKVARNRLQIDARKWALSKMAPKKYGDKIEVDSNVTIESINIKDLVNFK